MKLLHADEFIYHLMSYRVCNIRGGYGKGKTLLSVAIAYHLITEGYVNNIYANFPMAGRDTKFDNDEKLRKNFVLILDEAHRILDARQFSKNASQTWLADLRKRNSVMILPAVLSVDNRFRTLTVQRMVQIGNILWIYRWSLEDGMGKPVEGTFYLLHPDHVMGAYDTEYIPNDNDFGFLELIMTGEKNGKITEYSNEDIQGGVTNMGIFVENIQERNISSMPEPKITNLFK